MKRFIIELRQQFFKENPEADEDMFINFINSIDLEYYYLNDLNPLED